MKEIIRLNVQEAELKHMLNSIAQFFYRLLRSASYQGITNLKRQGKRDRKFKKKNLLWPGMKELFGIHI